MGRHWERLDNLTEQWQYNKEFSQNQPHVINRVKFIPSFKNHFEQYHVEAGILVLISISVSADISGVSYPAVI